MRYSLILLLIIIFGCQPKYDVPITVQINMDWEFRQVGDSLWHAAIVPGNVFSDLVNNKFIEDPFIGDNEERVQWVSKADWEYRTVFYLDESTLNKKHLELNFAGLDTYASVFLNDSLILQANNAFREWNVNVKPILKTKNEISIVFASTSKYEEIEKNKLPYELPEGNRVFTRKPQFQYGWDWGPELNTIGVSGPIQLIANDDLRIRGHHINQNQLNDSIAKLNLSLDLANYMNGYTFELYVNDTLAALSKDDFQFSPYSIPFEINKPKYWWPHNLGDPYLYDIKVIAKKGRTILDTLSIKKGLRTIDLVAEEDSIGQSFYFKVNGVPVYSKGANYIPQHSFQNQVSDSDYHKLLNDVVDANMNMLRVWGGGIYEQDVFYELCDEKGILVWQDFMFACAMYPGDESFLKNVEIEAEYQVKRLRNHASLALWCGNNENSEGWHRWGWQSGRSETEKDEIWNSYLKIFDSILPRTVSKYSDLDYWESSPKYGRGNPKYKTEGDAHDWWIWHDAYPFEHLEENVPRFMSEFGFQSYPSYETVRFINQNDSLDIDSESFKNHQKHSRGFQLIDEYMQRDFPVTKKAEDYVYMSQLVQAYGITKGIKAQRRAKPHNMGTLFWQLNDCWPAISWSSIDFFGNWKALHYKAKESFRDPLVSSLINNKSIETWIVNDMLVSIKGTVKIKVLDFFGAVIKEYAQEVNILPNSSMNIHQIPVNELDTNISEIVILTEFDGYEYLHWLDSPKNLKLKNQPIQKRIKKAKDGYLIELKSETLQKDVFLFSETKGHFSNNYFDMLPNKSYLVHLKTSNALKDLKIISFNNFIR